MIGDHVCRWRCFWNRIDDNNINILLSFLCKANFPDLFPEFVLISSGVCVSSYPDARLSLLPVLILSVTGFSLLDSIILRLSWYSTIIAYCGVKHPLTHYIILRTNSRSEIFINWYLVTVANWFFASMLILGLERCISWRKSKEAILSCSVQNSHLVDCMPIP